MTNQRSLTGTGMILTLLMLGLSHKGNYGEVPAQSDNISQLLKQILSTWDGALGGTDALQMNSLFVRSEADGGTVMIVLVVHDPNVTQLLRASLRTKQTPLLFSISTLPSTVANFDPQLIQFQQDGRQWHLSRIDGSHFFALFREAKFGGVITEGEIHHGLVMLPEWFDLARPVIIRYLGNVRTLRFK